MKKTYLYLSVSLIITLAVIGWLIYFKPATVINQISANDETSIKDIADQVILTLKNKDSDQLAKFTHPEKGIRFSPYARVYIYNDIVFSASQIKKMFTDQKQYLWGRYLDSELEIELTPAEYFAEFVYNADFINSKQVSIDKVIEKGGFVANLSEDYPEATIIEYYIPGVDTKYKGEDWQSLIIALEKFNDQWFIVGIIHNNIISTNAKPLYKEGLTRPIEFSEKNEPVLSPEEAKTIIEDEATHVITLLKQRNFKELAAKIHPVKGVRFTPYTVVDDSDLIFMADQIETIENDNDKYIWGAYDGSGFPIHLTFKKYFDMFVYSQDFADAEQVSYNQIITDTGFRENQFAAYPGSIIVEYCNSNKDSEFQGMDWQSLRLVFEAMDNNWYLVGIIHNQWTI